MRFSITISLFAVGLGLALVTAAEADSRLLRIYGEGEGRDVYCTMKSGVLGHITYCGSVSSSQKAWDQAAGEAFKDAKTQCDAKGGRFQTAKPAYRGGAGCRLLTETEDRTTKQLIYCKVRLPFNCYDVPADSNLPRRPESSSDGEENAADRFRRLQGTGLGYERSDAGETSVGEAR